MTKAASPPKTDTDRPALESQGIVITPAAREAMVMALWESVGDDGVNSRESLSQFEWLIDQCLCAGGIRTATD